MATRQAVILCGGVGTRLGSLVAEIPKPMLQMAGKPLLVHSIERLRRDGFDDFLLAAGYRAHVIRDYFARYDLGVSVRVFEEPEPLGTAGPLRLLEPYLDERFLVLYGDVFIDFSVDELWKTHEDSRPAATLLVHPSEHPWDSDLVEVDGESRVRNFLPAGQPRGTPRNLANAAIYVVTQQLIPLIPVNQRSDFVQHVFPAALQAGVRLQAHVFSEDGFFRDMGTPERLQTVLEYLDDKEAVEAARRKRKPIRTIFLDRDGVINEDIDVLDHPLKLRLLPGAGQAIARLNERRYHVIAITNQPVLARGLCDVATLDEVHRTLHAELRRDGARLDAIYYCPHHPETHHSEGVHDLRIACVCRKPATGLLMRARRDFQIDLASAVMIGDREVDVLTAHRAGIRSILVGRADASRFRIKPDCAFARLPDAVDAIMAGTVI